LVDADFPPNGKWVRKLENDVEQRRKGVVTKTNIHIWILEINV